MSAVIGNGNVALDVARILAKTRAEFAEIDIVNHAPRRAVGVVGQPYNHRRRRGPHQIGMTPKELGELGHLERAQPFVAADDLPPEGDDAALDPGQRKSVGLLRAFAALANGAAKPVTIAFDFFARPVAVEGSARVERLVVERTRLDDSGNAVAPARPMRSPAG